jgi:ribosomal protein L29
MTTELIPPADPEDAIAELRARCAELETQLAAERAARSTVETTTASELSTLREQLAALQNPAPAPAKKKRADGFFDVDGDE